MFSNGIVVMVVQLCKFTKNHYNCEFKTGISIIPQYNSYFKMLGSFSTPKEWPNYSTSLQMAFSQVAAAFSLFSSGILRVWCQQEIGHGLRQLEFVL